MKRKSTALILLLLAAALAGCKNEEAPQNGATEVTIDDPNLSFVAARGWGRKAYGFQFFDDYNEGDYFDYGFVHFGFRWNDFSGTYRAANNDGERPSRYNVFEHLENILSFRYEGILEPTDESCRIELGMNQKGFELLHYEIEGLKAVLPPECFGELPSAIASNTPSIVVNGETYYFPMQSAALFPLITTSVITREKDETTEKDVEVVRYHAPISFSWGEAFDGENPGDYFDNETNPDRSSSSLTTEESTASETTSTSEFSVEEVKEIMEDFYAETVDVSFLFYVSFAS